MTKSPNDAFLRTYLYPLVMRDCMGLVSPDNVEIKSLINKSEKRIANNNKNNYPK